MTEQSVIEIYLAQSKRKLTPKIHAVYARQLRDFNEFVQGDFSKRTVAEYVAHLRKTCRESTVNLYERIIRSFFRWMADNDYFETFPLTSTPLAKYYCHTRPTDFVITEQEYRNMLNAVYQRKRRLWRDWPGLLIVGWNTGLRLGDVCHLRGEQIDLDAKCIRLKPRKTAKHNRLAEVPFTPELDEYFAANPPYKRGLIFQQAAKTYTKDSGMLWKGLHLIFRRAGIKNKSFHGFRHGYISRLLSNGVPVSVVASVTGQTHKVIERYCHVSLDQKRQSLEAIGMAAPVPIQVPQINGHEIRPKGQEIGIVSYYSAEYEPLAALTVANKREYAERYGYRVEAKQVEQTCQLRAGYERIDYVLTLLQEPVRWLWVMGCDTMIMNFDQRIESFVDDNYHFIISHDGQCLNGDSYLVRNSPQGKALLQHLIDTQELYREHIWADSQAMTEAADEPAWRWLIKVVPQQGFNSYDPRWYPHQAGTFAEFKEGDFLIHWPGLSLEQRLEMAREYLPKVQR